MNNKKHLLSYQEQCPSIWLGRKQLGFHGFHIHPEHCHHDGGHDEAGDVDVGDDSDVDDVGDYGQLDPVKVWFHTNERCLLTKLENW